MKTVVLILATISLTCAAPRVGQLDFAGRSIDALEANGTYPYRPTVGGRIIDGEVVSIEQYQHQVSLLWFDSHICGGSLIAADVVVTAAHCVQVSGVIRTVSQLYIRSGSALSNVGGLLVAVSRIVVHPSYEDCLNCVPDYDVAILYLASDAIAPGVPAAPISMWDADTVFPDGIYATIFGWGATSEGGFGTVTLRSVDVQIVSEDICRAVYGPIISSRNICAVYVAGDNGACVAASGDSLVIARKLGGVGGVTSYGLDCGELGFPRVHTSIPRVRGWIRENANV